MGRASVWLLLFFVFTSAGGAMLQSTGVAADMGITSDLGTPSELENAQQNAKDVDTTGGFGQTLFGLYQSLGGGLAAIFGAINPSIGMLINLGVPAAIIGYASAGVGTIIGMDLISFLSGRDLI